MIQGFFPLGFMFSSLSIISEEFVVKFLFS